MPKPQGGLTQWFKEKWVDLSRPKEGGGFEPCGRDDAKSGKYPKCVPASRAARMTQEQIDSAIRRKRLAETRQEREGKKPIMVPTVKKESQPVPTDPELYAKVKAEAKKKFDVYPSAYANGWLVAEYKRRGGKYKMSKGDRAGHPFRGNQYAKATQHAKEIDTKLRAEHGDKVADTWKPLVAEAMKTWYGQGDMQTPIKVNGKKMAVGGREISAQNVLDTMADALGDQIITRGSTFGDEGIFSKGDRAGHPFRGNQWTGGRSHSGGRSSGFVEPKLSAGTTKQLKAMAEEGGFTYDPKRGVMRRSGVAVAIAKKYEEKTPVEEFKTNGEKTIRDYVQRHSEVLSQPNAHLGAWLDKGKVYLDVSIVKRSIDEAADLGRKNDQIGIFDLHNFQTWSRAKTSSGDYKYFPTATATRSNLGLINTGSGLVNESVGKQDKPKGVMLVPATSLWGDSAIQNVVEMILSMEPISKDDPTSSDVHVDAPIGRVQVIRNLKTKKKKAQKYIAKKEPLKDPKGGLTAAGRAKYNRETGSNLKPGVRGKADTPEKMRRKGSFLTRFFTNPSGPMVNDKGEPTRLALSAAAWGEPVPKNRSDAAKLAQKGRNLLDRYEKTKMNKGDRAGHEFHGNQWVGGRNGGGSAKPKTAGSKKMKEKRVYPSELRVGDKIKGRSKKIETVTAVRHSLHVNEWEIKTKQRGDKWHRLPSRPVTRVYKNPTGRSKKQDSTFTPTAMVEDIWN